MTKSFVFTLLLSVLAIPAFAAEINPAPAIMAAPTMSDSSATPPAMALPTVTKEVPTASGTMTTAVTPVTVTGGNGPGGAMVTTQTTTTPADVMAPVAPAPMTAAPVQPILGSGVTGVDNTTVAPAPAPAPVMQTQTMPVTTPATNSNNPLCSSVQHTPDASVAASPAPVAVSAPKMIPLSVDLANALGIKGFENIVSEGPIGFITVNDQGRVFFEGKDLSTNVANMCANGTLPPVPSDVKTPMTVEKAPDGSAYEAMPGQSNGFRMKPIIDGPSYKYPPKKKKAPKKVAVKKEELPEVKTEDVSPAVEAPVNDSAEPSTDDLGSMMRTAPATPDTVPMAAKPDETALPADESAKTTTMPADEAGLPTESQTGAAVDEVLGTGETTNDAMAPAPKTAK